jgi:hypothetical protein
MGKENSAQFYSADNFVYAYDKDNKKWFKYCWVDELPNDVKNQVRELKEKADVLKDVCM